MKIFFIQERIGKDGKPIIIRKFRSMIDCEVSLDKLLESQKGPYGKLENDERVTKIGKFLRRYWIDELPQLLSLIKGDMSLVGIRPLAQEDFEKLPTDIQESYIKYKPGFMSQLYANNVDGLEERIISERIYLEKKSEHPIMTDLIYFLRISYNILFKGARGI